MKTPVSILTAVCVLVLALTVPGRAGTTVFDALADTHPDFQVTVTGQGRPVIFIPGLATPGSIWQPAVDQLKGDLRMPCPDTRGLRRHEADRRGPVSLACAR